jgi:hypothetical protein
MEPASASRSAGHAATALNYSIPADPPEPLLRPEPVDAPRGHRSCRSTPVAKRSAGAAISFRMSYGRLFSAPLTEFSRSAHPRGRRRRRSRCDQHSVCCPPVPQQVACRGLRHRRRFRFQPAVHPREVVGRIHAAPGKHDIKAKITKCEEQVDSQVFSDATHRCRRLLRHRSDFGRVSSREIELEEFGPIG